MKTLAVRHFLAGIAFLLLVLALGLWSWNTLAGLFGLPAAGFKHVLAAGGLLWMLRWLLARHRHRGFLNGGYRHEQSSR